ncbi:MAG: hypothetical protein HXY50_14060 [Ignavibacteriaceae bacterium]|nr:hypothetical protein [Ignavibacteriaceae bacterium]
MKQLLFFLALVLLFIGCNKEDEKPLDEKSMYLADTSEIKTVVLEDQNEIFNLFYNLEKDKEYSYRLTNIAENTQTIKANDTTLYHKVKQTLTYLINFKVLDIDVDSIYEVTFNIKSVKLEADANGEKFYYESNTSKDSLDKQRYSEYVVVRNNPFNVRFNKFGELVEIYKADRIINEFVKLKGVADSISTAEKEFLKKDMIDRALKPIVVQVFRQFTNKMLSKDSTWTNVQEPSKLMIFQVNNTNKYKINGLELFNDDKIVNINAGLETVISGNNKFVDRGVTYIFNKPLTNAEGKVYFNLTKGCIQKSKTQSKIEMSYSMEVQTPNGLEKGSKSEVVFNTNILELL